VTLADFVTNLVLLFWVISLLLLVKAIKDLTTDDLGSSRNRDRCYDFKNILAEKYCKKLAFLLKTLLNYAKIYDHNIGF
jgi:hypothetical protein